MTSNKLNDIFIFTIKSTKNGWMTDMNIWNNFDLNGILFAELISFNCKCGNRLIEDECKEDHRTARHTEWTTTKLNQIIFNNQYHVCILIDFNDFHDYLKWFCRSQTEINDMHNTVSSWSVAKDIKLIKGSCIQGTELQN